MTTTHNKIKILLMFTILLSTNTLACSYIGDSPSEEELINNFDSRFEQSTEVMKVKVVSHSYTSNKFEIISIFKSARLSSDVFTYYDQTSCDMTFKTDGEEYIIFGHVIDDELYIFDANAMRSDHSKYKQLEDMLYGN